MKLDEGLSSLPCYWWRDERVCRKLSNVFHQHFLALYIVTTEDGKYQHRLYSGFGLIWSDRLWWITAGHVAQFVKGLTCKSRLKVKTACWFFLSGNHTGVGLPVHLSHLQWFERDSDGFDFGMATIRQGYALPILNDSDFNPITKHSWLNHEKSNPEGYYIVGIPDKWYKATETTDVGRTMRAEVLAELAVLPVQKIQDRGVEANAVGDDFWGHKKAFYGELLDFETTNGTKIDSIRGTSGGPLFSIERTTSGEVVYRLFGIQSSWLANQRIIRATSIGEVSELFDAVPPDAAAETNS